MKTTYSLIIFAVIAVMLYGCSPSVTYLSNGYGTRYVTDVNSYGNYSVNGKSFIIIPGDENINRTDPAFREFASLVAENLRCQGAYPARTDEAADMCILLNYGIADESYTTRVPVPVWGETGISSIRTTRYNNQTYTNVSPSYGITGFYGVDRHVESYKRAVDIYAYDNKHKDSPTILWKINLVSDGFSNDLRRVFPYMIYASLGDFGRSSGGSQEYTIFENDYLYNLWRQGTLSNDNVTFFPNCNSNATASKNYKIALVARERDETVVVIRKTGCIDWYSFSPYLYIETDRRKFQVTDAGHYQPGTKIKNECGTHYFVFKFPVIFNPNSTFDLIEYTDSKQTKVGFTWKNICIR